MNVDEIFLHIGEFGLYQKTIYVILNLLGITHGFRLMIAIFLLYIPKHRCAIPSFPNDTYEIQSEYHADLIRQFIPNDTSDDGDGPYDKCHIYASAGSNNNISSGAMVGCDRWVYDKSMFTNTAIMEFNAVCDESILAPHSQTAQMGGFLFGVLFFGAIGDRFGRKVAIYLAVLLYLAGGLALTWTPQAGYALFVFVRFANGATSAGAYTAICVLSVEMVGVNKRLWVGVIIHLSFALGALVLDLIGYFERDWMLINIFGTAPAILALSFWWIIPESPRWLVKKGRSKEAMAVLKTIAKYNGKPFPDDLVRTMTESANQNGFNSRGITESKDKGDRDKNGVEVTGVTQSTATSNKKEGASVHQNHTGSRGVARELLRMFTFRVLLIRCLVIFLNWLAVGLAFYGLSLTAGQLGAGGLFTNFMLTMSMDFVAGGFLLVLLDRWGRRWFQTINMLVAGVSCLLGVLTTMVLPTGYQWVTVVVAMIGKVGVTAGFILIYIYSSELYPTTVRSASMGISSAWARVGSISGSYVQQWSVDIGGDFGRALPLLVFGAVSLTAGLLTLLLPETLHKNLPDTLEDALVFGKNPDKDEREDPKEVVEVYTVDNNIQIEMKAFRFSDTKDPGDNTMHGRL